jgi:hypothetical protein
MLYITAAALQKDKKKDGSGGGADVVGTVVMAIDTRCEMYPQTLIVHDAGWDGLRCSKEGAREHRFEVKICAKGPDGVEIEICSAELTMNEIMSGVTTATAFTLFKSGATLAKQELNGTRSTEFGVMNSLFVSGKLAFCSPRQLAFFISKALKELVTKTNTTTNILMKAATDAAPTPRVIAELIELAETSSTADGLFDQMATAISAFPGVTVIPLGFGKRWEPGTSLGLVKEEGLGYGFPFFIGIEKAAEMLGVGRRTYTAPSAKSLQDLFDLWLTWGILQIYLVESTVKSEVVDLMGKETLTVLVASKVLPMLMEKKPQSNEVVAMSKVFPLLDTWANKVTPDAAKIEALGTAFNSCSFVQNLDPESLKYMLAMLPAIREYISSKKTVTKKTEREEGDGDADERIKKPPPFTDLKNDQSKRRQGQQQHQGASGTRTRSEDMQPKEYLDAVKGRLIEDYVEKIYRTHIDPSTKQGSKPFKTTSGCRMCGSASHKTKLDQCEASVAWALAKGRFGKLHEGVAYSLIEEAVMKMS